MLEGNEGTYFRHVPVSYDGSMIASTWRKLPATAIVELEIEPVSHPEGKCKVCRHLDTDSYVKSDEYTQGQDWCWRSCPGFPPANWSTRAVESNRYPTVHSLFH